MTLLDPDGNGRIPLSNLISRFDGAFHSASGLKITHQLQLNVAVAFTPPQIPEASAVMVAGEGVVPMQVATPLVSMPEFTISEVVQFASVKGLVLSDVRNRQVAVAVEFL